MEHSIMRQRAGALEVESPAPCAPSRAPRVWAGAILLLGGLCLIVLAGCFLIGAMLLVRPDLFNNPLEPAADTNGLSILLWILYGMTALCMAVALMLLTFGMRGLVQIMRESGRDSL